MPRRPWSVDYEVLPAVSDCRDAVKPDAPRAHSDLASNIAAFVPMSYGDVDAAFASAPHVFEDELLLHRGAAMTLEGRAVLASHDAAADLLTVWSATQTPHLARGTLADLFERDLESIRVIAPAVGGGFGTKAPFYAEEAVIPAAAMKLGRPVKWQEDRREHFLQRDAGARPGLEGRHRGRPRRQDSRRCAARCGTTPAPIVPWGIIAPYIAATTFPGPYVVPAYKIELTVVLTNRVPTTVVRGAGRPQAVFAMERLMDRVARELEARPRRGARAQHDPARADALLGRARCSATASRWSMPAAISPRARRARSRSPTMTAFARGRRRRAPRAAIIGIGIGNYVEGTGLGPFEGVTIRVMPNGKVAVATGATAQGQGTRTTLSQIVADHVGCRARGHRDDRRRHRARSRRASALSPAGRRSMPATPR